ncbi:MrcB family domain-containing protein [Streptomyces sp. NPDC012623]|uniref:MrcB family domain-containing protein n=1 Tax=unclassified Streptomyces TaxID=2593676 RepID=UPI0036C4E0F8
MGIQGLLREIADTYDASEGTRREVVGQRVLREVAKRTDLHLPSGLIVKGYGGQASAAATPWVGVFDPEINRDPREGLYLAYIFRADLRTVSLTLQQGITNLEERLGKGKDREEHLRHHAKRLRRAVGRLRRSGWDDEPVLLSKVNRPKAYEAASVISRCYDTNSLPSEDSLQDDLAHALVMLREVHSLNEEWWDSDVSGRPEVGFVPDLHVVSDEDLLSGFSPKDSSEYLANITARQQVKKRNHELLIKSFGLHVASLGFTPITKSMHPRDVVLKRPNGISEAGEEWLVEAKIIRNGNSTEAVRGAVGQLYEYSHFWYREKNLPKPHLVGLFNENIGVYADYLEHQGIGSIWQDGEGWSGSSLASGWGMI